MPVKEFEKWLELGRLVVWRDIQDGRIIAFRVVLLAEIEGETHCVARYDTAHGTPHQDILGRMGGMLAKNWFFNSSYEKVFTYAIHDLQAHTEDYLRFYQEN